MAEGNGTTGFKLSKGIGVEWEIDGDLIRYPEENGELISSPHFQSLNSRWKIDVHPCNGAGYLSLYLSVVSEDCLLSVSHLIILQIGKLVIHRSFFEHGIRAKFFGYPNFVETSKLLEHLQGSSENLKVICIILDLENCSVENAATQTSRIENRVTENYKDLYLRNELCDVNIKVGPKNYQAHKAILCARSPVFSSMLNNEMAENMNGSVEIPDCGSESFETFLRYIYTGDNDCICDSNALYLYKTADKYLMEDLKKVCCTRMSEKMNIHSFCDVLDLAVKHNETDLLQKTINFFTENLEEILTTEKWLKLIQEKPLLANECLSKMARGCSIQIA